MVKLFEVERHPQFAEMTSPAELLRIQEEEYRNSAVERYADDFAAELLQNHADEFGLTAAS